MICEKCKQQAATVHMTDIYHHGGTKKEVHLCDACADKQGVTMSTHPTTVTEILGNLAQASGGAEIKQLLEKKCPHCGITYPEFRTRGRLGCAKDYEVFRRGLDPLLEKIHGKTEHVGKIPTTRREDLEAEREVRNLRLELDRAVDAEEYERAAGLRDRIRALEAAGDAEAEADPESGSAGRPAAGAGDAESAAPEGGDRETGGDESEDRTAGDPQPGDRDAGR